MLVRRLAARGLHNKYAFYDLLLQQQRPGEAAAPASFEGAYNLEQLTPEERIARVFGGRIRGDARQSSSRFNVGDPRVIAGVKVPAKPVEPNNCCMSGCVNCVWEVYNDDVKDWNDQRKKAAQRLAQHGGQWPADFDPPHHLLQPENRPEQNAEAPKQDEWSNVPVSIRVFAEMERKKKLKQRQSAKRS